MAWASTRRVSDVTGIVVHIAGNDQQRGLAAAGKYVRQTTTKLPAAIEMAVADRNAHDAGMRREVGQQRQFHLDGMFLLVGLGIQLQPRNGFTQLFRQLQIGRDIDARQRPDLAGSDRPLDTQGGVFGTNHDDRLRDLDPSQDIGRDAS